MTDIELVIKIPEKTYKLIQALVRDDYFEHDICGASMRIIANGTPLPKGHGDLIDRKELNIPSEEMVAKMAVHYAPTIIEADKETDNENSN